MKKVLFIITICVAALAACTMKDDSYRLPAVTTEDPTSVSANAAELHGYLHATNNTIYVRRAFDVATDTAFTDYQRYYMDAQKVELFLGSIQDINLTISDLTASTVYYCRAVINPEHYLSGEIYGNTVSFKTGEQKEQKIIVTTGECRSITSCTARTLGSCQMINCSLKESGLLLSSTKQVPTLDSYEQKSSGQYTDYISTWYLLKASTKYYVRAYAQDTKGNVYYGLTTSFTTKSEPGGPLTVSDFTGTYTLTAHSEWEQKDVEWNDVQIIPYNGDTVVAVGWDDKDYLRAVGIFDKGRQIVRFESGWYFAGYTFDITDANDCIAMFTPVEYSTTDNLAYNIEDGGRAGRGEIWCKQNSTNNYEFTASDGDDINGRYANGIIFLYLTLNDLEKKANSQVYTNIKLQRTSTTVTRSAPRKIRPVGSNRKRIFQTQELPNIK